MKHRDLKKTEDMRKYWAETQQRHRDRLKQRIDNGVSLVRHDLSMTKILLSSPDNKIRKEIELLNKLRKNHKGSAALVVMLIIAVVALVVGAYLLAMFQTSMPSLASATYPQANATITNIFAAGWNAFGIAVVIPIIVVAGVIIGYVARSFMGAGAHTGY